MMIGMVICMYSTPYTQEDVTIGKTTSAEKLTIIEHKLDIVRNPGGW
jgi:hypothetical protein